MDTHKNAPLTPAGRLRMVQAVLGGETVSSVAQRCRTDRKSVRKWVRRYRAEGEAGLRDRSSRPHRSPRRIAKGTAQRAVTLRRRRWTMANIAGELRISRASVSRILARAGLSRLAVLDPAPLPRRYERAIPGCRSCHRNKLHERFADKKMWETFMAHVRRGRFASDLAKPEIKRELAA